MATLKQSAAKIEQEVTSKLARGTITFPLPIYGGRYAARFGVLGQDAMTALEQATESLTAENAHEAEEVTGQMVADACRVILAKTDARGEWESLTHEDGRPVLFDQDFATELGLDPAAGHPLDSMAAVVLACWVTTEGDLASQALIAFVERLMEWMRDTTKPVEGEIVEGQHGGPKSSG
jgi:hypothetical protein